MTTKQITEPKNIESIQYKKLIIDILNEIESIAILKRIYLFITTVKG